MNPTKVDRNRLRRFTDLPNVGPAFARDLKLLGFKTPAALKGKDPLKLYRSLSRKTGTRQDPCVLDTFISITRFMDGDKPKAWWSYTAERKERYGPI